MDPPNPPNDEDINAEVQWELNDDLNDIDLQMEHIDDDDIDMEQYFLGDIEDGGEDEHQIVAAEHEDENADAVINDPDAVINDPNVAHEGDHIADAAETDIAVVQVRDGIEYIDAPIDEEQVVFLRTRRARDIIPSRRRSHFRW